VIANSSRQTLLTTDHQVSARSSRGCRTGRLLPHLLRHFLFHFLQRRFSLVRAHLAAVAAGIGDFSSGQTLYFVASRHPRKRPSKRIPSKPIRSQNFRLQCSRAHGRTACESYSETNPKPGL
jgi:hypothetical protein